MPRPPWKRIATLALALLLVLVAAAGGLFVYHGRDRHPGYALDLRVAAGEPAPLRAGFAAVDITPAVPDTWTDRDGDARLDEGEPREDGDGDGRFEPVWLAGFHQGRAATGVHDPLWARALVLDDGRTRLALVVLDAIGLMHDQVVRVREAIDARAGLDYVLVATTHTHQAPDLMGLWGPGFAQSGIDPAILERTIEGAARAAERAAAGLRPAELRLARAPEAAAPLVEDSRPPEVLDPGLRLLHAVDAASGETLGVLAAWANHPETLFDRNTLVSSDYPHFLRRGLEEGLRDETGALRARGLGGVALFANGAIGGLMTTRPGFPIEDPLTGERHEAPGFAKARAQGRALAKLALEALRGPGVRRVREASLALRAHTLELPVDNGLLLLGAGLGVLPRGLVRMRRIRSEVAAFSVGPASFIAVPGEIYPEIVNGGITAPPGADYAVAPVEVPPLRERMPGRLRFVIGQANDAIGYVIPKSEWDDEPPWLYGAEEETYGEIVSLGPETAPRLHAALLGALEALHPPAPAPGSAAR